MRFDLHTTLSTPRKGLFSKLLFCIVAVSGLVACEQPPVFKPGAPAKYEGMEFTMLPYELELLELDTDNGTAKYAKPLLVLPVKIKNISEKPFLYNPVHRSQQMTEETTPLLYLINPQPGVELKLPPENKTIINGAYLEKGIRKGQLTERTTIAPGQEVTDYFLFEDPGPSEAELVFSIPPSMTEGKLPVLFQFHYTPKPPIGPKSYKVGEDIKLGDATFKITGDEIAYVEIEDAQRGKGYTSQPLLRIDFSITNDGKNPFTYKPDHRIVGTQGPGLFNVSQTIGRARLQPTTKAYKQQNDPIVVQPGATISDYLLFIPPTQGGEYKLEFPANLFGQPGLARVVLNVETANPSMPEELPSVVEAAAAAKAAGGGEADDDSDDADDSEDSEKE